MKCLAAPIDFMSASSLDGRGVGCQACPTALAPSTSADWARSRPALLRAFLPGIAQWRKLRHVKSYQEFDINYFQDEDGMFTAEVPAIRGCVAWGKTLVEAYHNAVDAIESCLEARAKCDTANSKQYTVLTQCRC